MVCVCVTDFENVVKKSDVTDFENDVKKSDSPPIIPVPVPVYVPAPMMMYNSPFPVPLFVPIPVPVPIFIPTTAKSPDDLKEKMKVCMKVHLHRFIGLGITDLSAHYTDKIIKNNKSSLV